MPSNLSNIGLAVAWLSVVPGLLRITGRDTWAPVALKRIHGGLLLVGVALLAVDLIAGNRTP